MARKKATPDVCRRLAELRQQQYGQRGKADFAKDLGISPSTYNYYEAGRVPPAELLVRIADLAKVDLRWLLTGKTSAVPVPAGHPAVARIAALLADHPQAAEPLSAFVELLAASLAWPAKSAPPEPESAPAAAAPAPAQVSRPSAPPRVTPEVSPPAPPEEWIPVLGRSAAGVPQFWADDEEGKGVTMLSELVERHARRVGRQVRPALAAEGAGRSPQPVQIVALPEPDEANAVEFVVAGELKRRHPDAFAVRIDGDSMAPEIRHGDIVICSASAPAADGAPAIVQLAGQIGVTCKLFRREGQSVHLVPVNEHYAPQTFPVAQVTWACRVLARVRSGAERQ